MKTIVSYGRIDNGVLHINRRKDFDAELRKHSGVCRIEVSVGKRRHDRQNAYYWLMNQYIAEQIEKLQWGGWTAQDVHETNKMCCNSKTVTRVLPKSGEIIDEDIPQTTTDLTIGGFAEYVERCKTYWAGQGIEVPETFE